MEKQISEKRKQILSVEELLKNSKLSDENYDKLADWAESISENIKRSK